jgi:hypothetical protein
MRRATWATYAGLLRRNSGATQQHHAAALQHSVVYL